MIGTAKKVAEIAYDLTCGDELLESRFYVRKEPFAGFGEANTARGAYEECGADARLERAYRLAHRRRRDTKLRSRESFCAGRPSETPPHR